MKIRKIKLIHAFNEAIRRSEDWTDDYGINQLIELLPHGSGIDGKTELNWELCGYTEGESPKRIKQIVIDSHFHHMDAVLHGYH